MANHISTSREVLGKGTVRFDGRAWGNTAYLIKDARDKNVAHKVPIHQGLVDNGGMATVNCVTEFASGQLGVSLDVLQAFVTVYDMDRPNTPPHVDGAPFAGIVALRDDKLTYGGGGLRAVIGEHLEEGRIPDGHVALLVGEVLHESIPITHGRRAVLVVFWKQSE